MRKYLPTIAMVVGALVAFVPVAYTISRMIYLYSAGQPINAIRTDVAQHTLFCLLVVPFGLLGILGGWIWARNDREVEQDEAALRERKKRPEKPVRLPR